MTPILRTPGNTGRTRSRGLLVVVLASVVLGVAACNQASATTSLGTPTPTGTLPAFSDWRAAYESSDGHLQVITFDGKTDLRGPLLPYLSPAEQDFVSAGFAPNGQVLAYNASNGLTIVHVATRPMQEQSLVALGDMNVLAWSPDSSQLAAGDNQGSLYTVSVSGAGAQRIPVQPLPQGYLPDSYQLVGWIDDTHLAVTVEPNGPTYTTPDRITYVTARSLGALDVTSGQLRLITTISFPGLAEPVFALSPDGKTALFYNAPYRDDPFTPDVEVIDTQTGARRPLPSITQTTQAGFNTPAWQPGTQTIAVSNAFGDNGNLQSWVLNTQQDRATKLLAGQYVAGWAPNQGPLIVATSNQSQTSNPPYDITGSGPYDLSAVTIAPSGQITTTLLTHSAWTFPFLGFARTAT